MRSLINRSITSLLAIICVVVLTTSANAELSKFQIPDKVSMKKNGNFSGSFVIGAMEPGVATLMGRSLKQVLSKKMEGYAIVRMRVTGVNSLDKAIPGVIETGRKIATNLSKVRLKKVVDGDSKIFVSIKGKDKFTAGDIEKHTNAFEIVNPDLVIAHLDTQTQFDIELQVEFGKNYRSAKRNTLANSVPGVFGINALFSPVVSVANKVVNLGAKKQLVIDITTDGTRLPEEVMKDAASVIKRSYDVFGGEFIGTSSRGKLRK